MCSGKNKTRLDKVCRRWRGTTKQLMQEQIPVICQWAKKNKKNTEIKKKSCLSIVLWNGNNDYISSRNTNKFMKKASHLAKNVIFVITQIGMQGWIIPGIMTGNYNRYLDITRNAFSCNDINLAHKAVRPVFWIVNNNNNNTHWTISKVISASPGDLILWRVRIWNRSYAKENDVSF